MKKGPVMKIFIKKWAKDILGIIVGSLIMAIGTSLFLLPNQLSSGGFAGISTIIYYLFKLPLGTTMFVFKNTIINYGFY